jgi:hypothetical protein
VFFVTADDHLDNLVHIFYGFTFQWYRSDFINKSANGYKVGLILGLGPLPIDSKRISVTARLPLLTSGHRPSNNRSSDVKQNVTMGFVKLVVQYDECSLIFATNLAFRLCCGLLELLADGRSEDMEKLSADHPCGQDMEKLSA